MEELEPGEVRGSGVLERRKRLVFSTWQLEVLEGLYRRSSSVDQGRMEVVARHLTLPTKSVRTWFKNRRSREPKDLLEDKDDVTKLEESLMLTPKYEYHEEPGCDIVSKQEGSLVSMLTPKTELCDKTLEDVTKTLCKYCDFSCALSSNLKRHMMKHSGEKPYKCELCDFVTNMPSYLKRHTQRHSVEKPYKHNGEKPYQCKFCDYACFVASSLKVHLRIHTGEKPYKCKSCDYEATTHSSLKVHARLHTGEKPYECGLCGYACRDASTLKVHIRKHTGEKPFKCDACNYATTTSSALKTHTHTMHSELCTCAKVHM